jgi:hypothetical protein
MRAIKCGGINDMNRTLFTISLTVMVVALALIVVNWIIFPLAALIIRIAGVGLLIALFVFGYSLGKAYSVKRK